MRVFHNIFSGVSVLRVNAILLYFQIFADTMIISQYKFKEVLNQLSDRKQKPKKKKKKTTPKTNFYDFLGLKHSLQFLD